MPTNADAPLVLVADDEINTTLMVQHIFEREGFRVERVNNGIAALESARSLQPDVILLDILMPGMNGFEVLRQLREDETTRHIPTIMVTANARQPSDLAHGFDLGADDYIYKPFAHQELIARAVSKIKAHKLQIALARRTEELESMLKVSEHFGQSVFTGEFLELAAELVGKLLPCDAVVIVQFGEDYQVLQQHVYLTQGTTEDQLPLDTVSAQYTKLEKPIVIPFNTLTHSILLTPLRHASRTIGAVAVFSATEDYDEDQVRLLDGVARQAALALHNALLYEFQVEYAHRLEEKVEERSQELQSAQNMLIRSEKLASIGHMAASLAHEINTPLMPIKLGLDEVVSQLEEEGVTVDARDIAMIRENIERIQRMIRRLLDFTRAADEGMSLVNVADVLDDVLKLNRKFFEHEHVKLETHIAPILPVLGSPDHLQQVFMNMAVNAQNAMSGGGTLIITADVEDNQVVIRFKDTGTGIAPENMERIFNPFFSTKPQGTGLGLFVSYGIIEAHNGVIEVESTVNVGTQFTVRLPVYQGEQAR